MGTSTISAGIEKKLAALWRTAYSAYCSLVTRAARTPRNLLAAMLTPWPVLQNPRISAPGNVRWVSTAWVM